MTGPPAAICLSNNGITEPVDPSTLPKRTVRKRVLCFSAVSKLWQIDSAARLVAPIIFVGSTALSVEISTIVFTLFFKAALATFHVPMTLVLIPSIGLLSTNGTCFNAAE